MGPKIVANTVQAMVHNMVHDTVHDMVRDMVHDMVRDIVRGMVRDMVDKMVHNMVIHSTNMYKHMWVRLCKIWCNTQSKTWCKTRHTKRLSLSSGEHSNSFIKYPFSRGFVDYE